MQLKHLLILSLIVLVSACKNESSKTDLPKPAAFEKRKIDSLETTFKAHSDRGSKDSIIDDVLYLTEAYANYAYLAPEDTMSPVYMMRRGQLFTGMLGNHKKAGEIFNQVWSKYPNFRGRPIAFLMAANAWYTAGDTLEAKNVTKTFLAQYPDHEFKKDILALDLLLSQRKQQSLEDFARESVEKAKKDSLKTKKGV